MTLQVAGGGGSDRCHGLRVISMIQPVYLPWLGYFEQMAMADIFVALDDVQYTPRDWRNRNRIKHASGSMWLTVPVRRHPRTARIGEIEVNYEQDWRRAHLRAIEVNYRGCVGFEPLYGELKRTYSAAPSLLADLDLDLISLVRRHLGITTPIHRSSDVPRKAAEDPGDANDRIIEICRYFDSNVLYDGARAVDFIDVERFRRAGIRVVFQDYRHPRYPQRFGDFISHQSAIDLIMNVGSDAPRILRTSPVAPALAEGERTYSADGSADRTVHPSVRPKAPS